MVFCSDKAQHVVHFAPFFKVETVYVIAGVRVVSPISKISVKCIVLPQSPLLVYNKKRLFDVAVPLRNSVQKTNFQTLINS
jgi:hypothetical protein